MSKRRVIFDDDRPEEHNDDFVPPTPPPLPKPVQKAKPNKQAPSSPGSGGDAAITTGQGSTALQLLSQLAKMGGTVGGMSKIKVDGEEVVPEQVPKVKQGKIAPLTKSTPKATDWVCPDPLGNGLVDPHSTKPYAAEQDVYLFPGGQLNFGQELNFCCIVEKSANGLFFKLTYSSPKENPWTQSVAANSQVELSGVDCMGVSVKVLLRLHAANPSKAKDL